MPTNESCPECRPDGLKISKVNGVTRVEVPQDFASDKLGSYQNQFAQAMAFAESAGVGEQLGVQPSRPWMMPSEEAFAPALLEDMPRHISFARFTPQAPTQPARRTSGTNQFTLAETEAADVLGRWATDTPPTTDQFTLASTDAADVLGFTLADDPKKVPAPAKPEWKQKLNFDTEKKYPSPFPKKKLQEAIDAAKGDGCGWEVVVKFTVFIQKELSETGDMAAIDEDKYPDAEIEKNKDGKDQSSKDWLKKVGKEGLAKVKKREEAIAVAGQINHSEITEKGRTEALDFATDTCEEPCKLTAETIAYVFVRSGWLKEPEIDESTIKVKEEVYDEQGNANWRVYFDWKGTMYYQFDVWVKLTCLELGPEIEEDF